MLEFISFQLALHHPRGTVDEVKGARAHDWALWKSQLLSLYKVIVVEIDELCEKNKYSSRYSLTIIQYFPEFII